MHTLLRATALTAAVAGLLSCARLPGRTSAENEYAWVLDHGGCDCGPVAYAPGSAEPSWVDQNVGAYIKEKAMHCASKQFVVAAFGDSSSNLERDMELAHARADMFLRGFRGVAYRRLDTLVFAGGRIAHPSTLVVTCPRDPLPAQNTF